MRTLAALAIWLAALLAFATPALAQSFPPLTGRVVDAANMLSAETETRLTGSLAALEQQSRRQLVVATVPDLGGMDVADYGYQLGRHWQIGDKDRNDGAVLLIAPNERRMHIAVGYGLEPVLTDALSARIIRETITPQFRAGNFDAGVIAGTDAIIRQLQLPPEEAAAAAQAAAADARSADEGDSAGLIIFWLFIFLFFILPILLSMRRGRRHGRNRRSHSPIIIWGPSTGDWGGGGGWRGGGFGGGGFGGGGFSGGGGSFGGGGASGGW